jgi:hypothetical protein
MAQKIHFDVTATVVVLCSLILMVSTYATLPRAFVPMNSVTDLSGSINYLGSGFASLEASSVPSKLSSDSSGLTSARWAGSGLAFSDSTFTQPDKTSTSTLTGFSAAPLPSNLTASSVSSNLGVYSDEACTIPFEEIKWGSLAPGGTVNRIVYVKNTQADSSLTLNLAAANWNPTSADGPLKVTWNRQETVLAPEESVKATIQLWASNSVVGISSFAVQIIISGIE